MEIVEYQEKYKKDFIELNTQWVERYFVIEQADSIPEQVREVPYLKQAWIMQSHRELKS